MDDTASEVNVLKTLLARKEKQTRSDTYSFGNSRVAPASTVEHDRIVLCHSLDDLTASDVGIRLVSQESGNENTALGDSRS